MERIRIFGIVIFGVLHVMYYTQVIIKYVRFIRYKSDLDQEYLEKTPKIHRLYNKSCA